jgi:hypothetical protein
VKIFSDEWVARLNAQHGGGVFFKAAIVTVDDLTTNYYADVHDPVTFNSNLYLPLPMAWEGNEQTAQMSLPSIRVTVPNISGAVGAYLETTSLLGRDVTLQLLHQDLLSVVTDVDTVQLQVMMVEWGEQAAVFTLGLNLALTEQLPRGVVTRAEFPATPDTLRRASIL